MNSSREQYEIDPKKLFPLKYPPRYEPLAKVNECKEVTRRWSRGFRVVRKQPRRAIKHHVGGQPAETGIDIA